LGATILFDNDKYDGYPFTSKQQYSNIVNIHKEIQQLKNSINTDCKSIISKKYQQKQSNTLKRKHSPSISSTNQSP
jgi:DNA repair ATPase RecN